MESTFCSSRESGAGHGDVADLDPQGFEARPAVDVQGNARRAVAQ
jgi:hypothetical protein